MDSAAKTKKISKYGIKGNDAAIGGPQSILTIIDEKNNLIQSLKKQIINQKVQLSHYLQKSLDDASVAEFRKYCLPTYVDENLRVNLAMCKFYKETQLKSPIRDLYEQMFDLDRRLSESLGQQENIIQIVLDILMKFAKTCVENGDAEVQLKSFLHYFSQFDIFNELLSSTKSLQNDLNTMKVYCNRLVVIEDERNSLVDQIYTKPLDQQACCNYVMSIMSDRKSMENELKNLKEDMQSFMTQLPMLAEETSRYIKCAKEVHAKHVLDFDVDTAMDELKKTKMENVELLEKIVLLQKQLDNKAEADVKLQALERKCLVLQQRLAMMEAKKSNSSVKALEVRGMEQKINKLQEKIAHLKTQSMEMAALKKNLAYYKLQVDTLEREKHNIEREKVEAVNDLAAKVESSKDVVDLLKKQIQYLLLLLYYMREDNKNKKTMDDMNQAISVILSDIDVLLLKTDDSKLTSEVDVTEDKSQHQQQHALDLLDHLLKMQKLDKSPPQETGQVNKPLQEPEVDNEMGLNSEDEEALQSSTVFSNESDVDQSNSIQEQLHNNSAATHGNSNASPSTLDRESSYTGLAVTPYKFAMEAEVDSSLKLFVQKFDEITRNINRILHNFTEKQQ